MDKTFIDAYHEGYICGIAVGQERDLSQYIPGEETLVNNPVNDNPISYIGFVQGYREAIFYAREIAKMKEKSE